MMATPMPATTALMTPATEAAATHPPPHRMTATWEPMVAPAAAPTAMDTTMVMRAARERARFGPAGTVIRARVPSPR